MGIAAVMATVLALVSALASNRFDTDLTQGGALLHGRASLDFALEAFTFEENQVDPYPSCFHDAAVELLIGNPSRSCLATNVARA
ncbi:hypothetical protein HOV93_03310 [Planctomycetes bacterium FF15]|uniref:Uncharacterized protein n=1 Tax=Bremerella alba TaxID=980252 RepID=A0A7V9A5G4_9BACT|nr:hypothetical protein [Bremerella alba]